MASTWPLHPLRRGLDIVGSLILLGLLAIPFAFLLLLHRLILGSPTFFRQPRPGKDGRLFTLIKVRTLQTGDAPDAERQTGFGNWLRKTSLDELPELLHILKGEMSFIGPRPLLPVYLERYSPEQARRHEVRPGLTGWAQVNGRNDADWDTRLAMDVWYVDHASPLLDLRILWRTALHLLTGSPGAGPAEEFKGSSERNG
jgi:lipopolysaccharide/colanic/teichoic acid biosynthesis glycosyltransferase